MKVVKVQWIDSCSGDCYWTMLKDFQPTIVHPVTYGLIIHEDEKTVSIAQTYAMTDGVVDQINGVMTIPKIAIVKMDIIDEIKEE